MRGLVFGARGGTVTDLWATTYDYVGGNPLRCVDVDGHWFEDIDAIDGVSISLAAPERSADHQQEQDCRYDGQKCTRHEHI